MESQQKALKEVQDALEVATKRVADADQDLESRKGYMADYEAGRTDMWFQATGVESSLVAAVQVPLRMNVDASREFAQAAVTGVEEAYKDHIETLEEKFDFGSDISAPSAGVKAAQDVAGGEAAGVVRRAECVGGDDHQGGGSQVEEGGIGPCTVQQQQQQLPQRLGLGQQQQQLAAQQQQHQQQRWHIV